MPVPMPRMMQRSPLSVVSNTTRKSHAFVLLISIDVERKITTTTIDLDLVVVVDL